MTKLDLNMSGKKQQDASGDGENGDQPTETENLNDGAGGGKQEPPATITVGMITPTIMIGDIEMNLTNEKIGDEKSTNLNEAYSTFDWRIIRRVSISQMILAMMAMTCVVISIVSIGMNCYKFSQFIMSLYLLFTGYSGLRGSTKSYKHLIVYFIMTALQWMINIVILGCLTFAVYDMPRYAYSIRYIWRKDFDYDDYGISIGVLLTEVISSATMMGTVITGMLGLTACCKGFGRLLTYQDQFLQSHYQSNGQV